MEIADGIMRILALITSCLCAGMAYSLDAFAVYSHDLKISFNIDQYKVENAITFGYLGMLSTLPAGIFCRKVGPRWMSLLAGVVGIIASLLCLASLQNTDYFENNFYIIIINYFLMGVAGGLMYVTAFSVIVNNFDSSELGLTTGLLTAFRSGIPGMLIILYIYLEGPEYYRKAYSISRLRFLYGSLAIGYGVVNLLGVICYGYYRKRSRVESLLQPGALRRRFDTNVSESTALLFKTNTSHKPKKWWSNFSEPEFHYVFWPSVTILGFKTSYASNISVFAWSFGFPRYNYTEIILTVLPFVATISRPIMGYCSDASVGSIARSALLLPTALIFLVTVCICVFMFDNMYVQGVSAVLLTLISGLVQTVVPPLLVALFGRTSFPVLWGSCTFGSAVFTSLFNTILAIFYDKHASSVKDIINSNHTSTVWSSPDPLVDPEADDWQLCVGSDCYRYYFVIALAFGLFSPIYYGLLWRQEAKLRIQCCKKHPIATRLPAKSKYTSLK